MDEQEFLSKEHPEKVVSSLEYIDYLKNFVPKAPPIYTGMTMLDKHMGGAVPGEFWILSGPSKHGKSTFMRTLIKEYYHQGALSMVFSFEETPAEFFEKFEGSARKLLFYVPRIRVAYDIDDMLDRAKEAKEKYGTKIMFVDSGQKVVHDVQQSASLAHVIGEMASRLKNFAVEENMVIWLIWHLKKDNIPLDALSANDLRDSGRLFQEADGLLFSYRSVKSEGAVKFQENYVKVHATRRSGAFEEVIPIVKTGPYFRELEVDDE